ncbi:MAG TPA: LemA family protein [Methanoculleus sp.]|jgi:LemA protein|uniref:LemA family protein n=1 Tax=Methanoculleus sp. TaxID=90427 RepID=UPI000A9A60A7|nr:LemA family protein [Methanoculleus sp.]MBP7143721.1 LemA family protein [Methanoculleus sp.]HNQ33079.1 LemA family protein [Methanoculleus sp.]HNV37535.1 LemA family protein [Methanoculleus sp.]HOF95796.1 LemA family protein [Methanoculleus sp.]HOI60774.1 LemA family protein [Methanoculleus sp.]
MVTTLVDIISLVLIAVVVLIVIGIVAVMIGIYNRFFSLKNSADATVGQVKVAMKKRLDMIEQLLGAVKSYAAFEKDTLTGVTAMRARIGSAGPGDLNELERESRSVLGRLIAVAENYPNLKTSQTVQDLMGAVKGIEDEIARHRYTYNNIAQQYNTMTDTIPSNLVASVMGFKKLEYLEFGEDIERVPTIAF